MAKLERDSKTLEKDVAAPLSKRGFPSFPSRPLSIFAHNVFPLLLCALKK